jgi:omega-amidase
MRISLAQMDVHLAQPAANFATAARMAAAAEAAGADVLVLPELWSTGYDLEHAAAYATDVMSGIFAETAVLARQHHLHIVGSCLSQGADGNFRNTAVWFDDNGRLLADYSKIHLFQLMDEHQYLTAGENLTVVDTVWGRVGLAICYDLRFPELFRQYALADCVLTILPAEWPHPRLAHWQTLLRARAIENQMFIAACNRVGQSKGTDFCGHSCVIDPWGEILLEGDESETLLTVELDLDRVTAVRRTIPIFKDRRPAIYEQSVMVLGKDTL